MALAPCLLGYSAIASRLYADPKTKRDGNIYWKWIENYVADDYAEAVAIGSGEKSTCINITSWRLTRKRYPREKCNFAVSKPRRRAGENLHSCN